MFTTINDRREIQALDPLTLYGEELTMLAEVKYQEFMARNLKWNSGTL